MRIAIEYEKGFCLWLVIIFGFHSIEQFAGSPLNTVSFANLIWFTDFYFSNGSFATNLNSFIFENFIRRTPNEFVCERETNIQNMRKNVKHVINDPYYSF